ncbi:16S rRNA (cytosine(1402)-N(4))-methyltransferase RsmH [Candidatus Marinimicrobia bacterium MT.SAG.3]|nr:16S rRNA (cytosine(1402)-N(4))-methyltransferase RsmH [Candidatus Marinimicrobia bacterium MT.SAG.3]
MGSDFSGNERHTPVMAEEVTEFLTINPDGVYIDGTIGGGGHAEVILDRLTDKALYIGIDKDATAIEYCKERFKDSTAKVELFQGNFSMMNEIAERRGIKGVDGVLLDLGVSSTQLDLPERGFSFSSDGPLDMRMDQDSGISAADLIKSLTERELADLIYEYGEERHSRKIATAIVNFQKESQLRTTSDLSSIVKRVIMGNMKTKSLARVFQALRIAVNNELSSLEEGLTAAIKLLKKGGRIVVLSYHSLEDRIVKNLLRDLSKSHIQDPESPTGYREQVKELKLLTKKVIKPTGSEIERNPRSRSARLRAAEKL